MRVVIVSEEYSNSGASVAAQRLFRGLASEKGVEVSFLYFSKKVEGRVPKEFIAAFPGLPLLMKRLMSRFRLNARELLIQTLVSKLRRLEPDVVNLHNVSSLLRHDDVEDLAKEFFVFWTMHDQFASSLACYTFSDCAGEIHQTVVRTPLPSERDSLERMKKLESLKMVGCSRWMRDFAIQEGFLPGNVCSIHNAVDAPGKRQERKGEVVRCEPVEKGGGTMKVLYVGAGGQGVRKNTNLVEALVERFKESRDIEFVVVGTVLPGEFEGEHVRILEPIHEFEALFALYQSVDVTIVPSLIDNLPNVVLESQLAGTPVLGANVGGIPEMIQEEKTGWLFDPCDVSGAEELLCGLIGSGGISEGMRENCRTQCREYFSLSRQATEYLNFFEQSIRT